MCVCVCVCVECVYLCVCVCVCVCYSFMSEHVSMGVSREQKESHPSKLELEMVVTPVFVL